MRYIYIIKGTDNLFKCQTGDGDWIGWYCMGMVWGWFLYYINKGSIDSMTNPLRSETDLPLFLQLSQSAKHLLTLQLDELTTLSTIFHIPTTDKLQSFQQLRKVLCEILMIERHNHEEYLQLPKFKRARPETVRKIGVFMEYVWLSFKQKKEEETREQMRRTMISQNLAFGQGEGGKDSRLGCYNYFPAYEQYQKFGVGMGGMNGMSAINGMNGMPSMPSMPNMPSMPSIPNMGMNGMTQPKMAYSPYPYYYNFPNYQYPQNFNQPAPVLKYNDYFRATDKGNQPAQEQSQSSAVIEPEISHNNKIQEQKHNEEVVNKIQHLQSNKGEAAVPQEPNIIDLQFLHCVCLGKNINSQEKYFQCPDCTNLYHFNCLGIQTTQAKSCPLCTLTKNHIFSECYARPIKSGWLNLQRPMDFYINKLRLEEDQMKIFLKYLAILEAGTEQPKMHSIQFRILKISDKGKAKGGKKMAKSTFPISLAELKKLEMRKWIQLKLKSILEPTVAFYVMIMVKAKSKQRIIEDYQELQNSGDLIERWRNEQRKEGKKIELSMLHPETKRVIELPIRGEQCQHLQCQDLLHLYNQFESSSYQTNNKLQCSHCKKVYSPHSKFSKEPALHVMLATRQNRHSLRLNQQNCLEWTEQQQEQQQQQHSQASESQSFS